MKSCFNLKVAAALVLVGLVVFAVVPNLITAALPLIVVAACPLSMVFMMRAMSRNGQRAQDGDDSAGREANSVTRG